MEISKEVSTNERTSSKVEVKAKVKKMKFLFFWGLSFTFFDLFHFWTTKVYNIKFLFFWYLSFNLF